MHRESSNRLVFLMTSLLSAFVISGTNPVVPGLSQSSGEQQSDVACQPSSNGYVCRTLDEGRQLSNGSTPNVEVVIVDSNMTSSAIKSRRRGSAAVSRRPKHKLIRGSKQAATITRREYLKADWCKSEPFQQIIHEEGCIRGRVLNRFCYGQCNSFFIPKSDGPELVPKNQRAAGDKLDDLSAPDYVIGHFRSCAVCTPKSTDWATVVLRCPRLNPPFRRRRVRIVRQCKCMALKLN